MQTFAKLTLILLLVSTKLLGQDKEIDRLIQGEFKMTFPSIHFNHKTTDYAKMPYSADSCLKYIASHFDENINSLVIWRDTSETEVLTTKRIKKIKTALKKYLQTKEFEIYSMGNEQKVSRHTIKMTSDSSKIKYLLTLNSVFDISKSRRPLPPSQSHIFRPKLFCWNCLKKGYHLDKKSRDLRKVARRAKQNK
jgi:REP element-mobilizing transposase RayT